MTETSKPRRPRAYAPEEPLTISPLWKLPPAPMKALKWLFGYDGYLWPWNILYVAVALGLFMYATPSLEVMRTFEWQWIAAIFARNVLIVMIVYGAWHGWFYVKRAQGTDFKYNPRWPSTDSPHFLFRSQNLDNMFWTFASGVPVWTAFECVTFWLYANGSIPTITFEEHPIYFVALLFFVPMIREVHFYLVHRIIHWPPLYKHVHSLHHKNVNPGPWSGLAMHPIEHVLYFSTIVFIWLIPSHPFHAFFMLVHAGLGPAQGHVGFDAVKTKEGGKIDLHEYYHYLHHKYIECNYGNAMLPMDQWFGTFHDGTPASEKKMNDRMFSRVKGRTEEQTQTQS